MQALIHIHMSSYVTIVSSRSHRKRSKVYTIQLQRRFAVKQIKRRMCSARAAMIRHFVSLTTYRIGKNRKKKNNPHCLFIHHQRWARPPCPSVAQRYIYTLFICFFFVRTIEGGAESIFALCKWDQLHCTPSGMLLNQNEPGQAETYIYIHKESCCWWHRMGSLYSALGGFWVEIGNSSRAPDRVVLEYNDSSGPPFIKRVRPEFENVP